MSYSHSYRPHGFNPLWSHFQSAAPSDWELNQIGKLSTCYKGKLPDDLQAVFFEGAKPYLLIEGLLSGIPQGFTAQSDLPECQDTDTCVVADGSRSGLALRGRSGVLGSTLLGYRAASGLTEGLLYYIIESLYGFLNKATTGGAIPHLDQDLLAKIQWPVPRSSVEQNKIVKVLELADDYIAAIEERVDKADKVKSALIEQCTTIGLYPKARLKVAKRYRYEFICNANWNQLELRALKPQIDYGTNQSSNPHGAGVPVIGIPQVLTSRFALSELPHVEISSVECDSLQLRAQDVLVVRTNGNPAYIGRSTVIPEGVLLNSTVFASYLIRIRSKDSALRGAYLNYVLQSRTGRVQSNCLANTSAGNFNLGARSLGKFLIPLPKIEEQDEIVQAIDAADDLSLGLRKQSLFAKRVKQSLLQSLLTGKLRLGG